MADSEKTINLKDNIGHLENEITDFQKKIANDKNITNKNVNPKTFIIGNIMAELGGGIITAFILNGIYAHFFGKNVLVFTLLLIFCSIAGLYNIVKYSYKIGKQK